MGIFRVDARTLRLDWRERQLMELALKATIKALEYSVEKRRLRRSRLVQDGKPIPATLLTLLEHEVDQIGGMQDLLVRIEKGI